jgi:hypothetical protein
MDPSLWLHELKTAEDRVEAMVKHVQEAEDRYAKLDGEYDEWSRLCRFTLPCCSALYSLGLFSPCVVLFFLFCCVCVPVPHRQEQQQQACTVNEVEQEAVRQRRQLELQEASKHVTRWTKREQAAWTRLRDCQSRRPSFSNNSSSS